MTTALYRRYRPDTFAAVIGQDHVTGPLRAALRANRVTHAYLFSGPRGCGKTTSARILARCLNCEQGPTDTPCGTCDSCRELATGGPGSLDVVEIDAASHGGVDDARELRERATFAPVRDRYKVFIIDEAHMVTREGFNALLKLVEEPPEHVKFVFATTEPDRVIGTIRSRTHHYPFRLVPPDVLGPYLASLAGEEGVRIDPGVFDIVMRSGGGSVRDTLSVLDQLIAGSIEGEVTYETAVSLLGYTDAHLLDETIDALAGGDGAAVYRVVERTVDSGHDPRRFVEDLLQRLRDLLIIAVAGDGAADVLVGVPSDQFDRMRTQAANWGPRALSRAADLADEALRQMAGATSPRLQLELLIGRILVPSHAPAARAVDEAPLPGTVGPAGGGAPREVAPSGSFGPKEAREQLQRSRASQADPLRSSAPETSQGAAPAQGASAAQANAWPSRPAEGPEPQTSSSGARPPAADSGWPDVVLSVAGAPSPADPPSARAPEPLTPQPMAEQPAAPVHEPSEPSQPPHASPQATDASAAHPDRPTEASPEPRAHASGKDADLIRGRWQEILDRLASASRATWSLVRDHAQLGAIDGDVLVLVFPNEGLARNMERNDKALKVSEAVYDITGVRVQVRTGIGQSIGGPAVTTPSALAAREANAGAPEEPRPFDRDRGEHDWSDRDRGEGDRTESAQAPSWPEPATPAVRAADAADADPREAIRADQPWPGTETGTEKEPGPGASVRPDAVAAESSAWPEVAPVAVPVESRAAAADPRSDRIPARPALSVFTYDEDEDGAAPEPHPEGPGISEGEALEPPASKRASDSSGSPSSQPQAYRSVDADQVAWPEPASVSLAGWNAAPIPGGPSVSFEDDSTGSAPSSDSASASPGAEAPAIDDTASIDDENIETTTRFGLPAILEVLGGKVVDEIYDEGAR
ncbi:DNA polymerase III subunit gamma and tau [Schaalia hyovaginalis]|uniref:DNA-directed DNA polymerase n=1 Tax=Schaalia hyovaginalis TaxID=29316 RepID=A0A923E6I9_9ACTO|nr:DNA polymerase-3 subunit gamma/tau [Schaalia hyovaginalis]